VNRIFVAMIIMAFAVASIGQIQWERDIRSTDTQTAGAYLAETRSAAQDALDASAEVVSALDAGDRAAAQGALERATAAAAVASKSADRADAPFQAGSHGAALGSEADAAALAAERAVNAAGAVLASAAPDRPVAAGQDAADRAALSAISLPEETAPPPEPIKAFSDGLFDMAKAAVMSIVLPLIGAMAFFLGLMKVAEAAGLMTVFARLLRPIMIRLFPDVPPDHPAMSAMILNMAANALGLGNAATPFGIKAMQELDRLNSEKGTATNAMCLFLAINTSSVTLLPTGVIAIRETLGSQDAAGILPTTLMATILSTTVAITAAKLFQRFTPAPAVAVPDEGDRDDGAESGYPLWVSALAITGLLVMVPVTVVYGSVFGKWIVPLMVVGFIGYGAINGVKVYEVFVAGAKEGFEVGVRIIPFLVAILAAVGMLRGSGAIDMFVEAVGPFTMALGLPAEVLPMALLRPLSGSGAYGVMMATLNDYGTDSFIGYLVSTLQGSTETTFYVIAVYFGAVQVQKTRHAMPAALTADFVGVIAATAACWLYFTYNGLL
jgi:spore maturation protein SpmA